MKNLTLSSGATVAVTQGDDVPVSVDGQSLDRLDLSMDLGTSYGSDGRVVCTRAKPIPSEGSPNGSTQLRRTIKLIVPRSYADKDATHDTVEVKIGSDVHSTSADILQMVSYMVQILSEDDSEDFITSGRLG